jgi:hypothetical protein
MFIFHWRCYILVSGEACSKLTTFGEFQKRKVSYLDRRIHSGIVNESSPSTKSGSGGSGQARWYQNLITVISKILGSVCKPLVTRSRRCELIHNSLEAYASISPSFLCFHASSMCRRR